MRRLRPELTPSGLPVLKTWMVQGSPVSGTSRIAGRPAPSDVFPRTECPSRSVSTSCMWRLSRRGFNSASHSDSRYFDPALNPATTLPEAVSYTHLRAHETPEHLVCRLL